MITNLGRNPSYTVDIGRPSIMTNNAVQRWKQIHNWVKESRTPVAVSGAFNRVDRYIQRNEFYQGGGYQYKFGFRTAEDKDAFIAAVNQALKDFPRGR